MGSSWSGGMVATEGILSLYASGSYHYQIMDGGVEVVFDPPVDSVEFFFVHGFDFPQGVATAFDAAGEMIGMVESREATEFGDPENFVSLDADAEIARIEFSGGGVIDNFTIDPPTGTEPPSSPPIEEGDTTLVLEEVASGLVAPLVAPLAMRILRQDGAVLAQQSAAIRRFDGEHFTSTEVDVLGPHIWKLLALAETGETAPPFEHHVTMRV